VTTPGGAGGEDRRPVGALSDSGAQGQQPSAAGQTGDGLRATHQPGPQPTDQPAADLGLGEGQQLQALQGAGQLRRLAGCRGSAVVRPTCVDAMRILI
jgi:hypothetical protein